MNPLLIINIRASKTTISYEKGCNLEASLCYTVKAPEHKVLVVLVVGECMRCGT